MPSAALHGGWGRRPDGLALDAGRPYDERAEPGDRWHDRLAREAWHGLVQPLWRRVDGGRRRARAVARAALAQAEALTALDDAALQARAQPLRGRLRRHGFTAPLVAEAFALVREAAARVLGKRHHPCQLQAGWHLLQGRLVEMDTGEGKTFAATLPATVAALAGLPVHVVTVNDYLAARDAEAMGPLYRFFGLRCAAVVHALDRGQRRQVYAQDVVYCSNKELTFDYLRDRAAFGSRASRMHLAVQGLLGEGGEQPVLRGLAMAIVDEADSVFIDEARTPLILSARLPVDEVAAQRARWAHALTALLRPGADYVVDQALHRVDVTESGRERITALAEAQAAAEAAPAGEAGGGRSLAVRLAEEAVQQALVAAHLYHRDRQYMVADGKVQIIDEGTGRVMADRAWERGLHQAIEVKEGVEPTGARVTLARITYQRFFARYLRLCGMTGTATEVAGEIGRVYGLPVTRVPRHLPSRFVGAPARCLPDTAAKWQAVTERVRRLAVDQGRPVLVGTRTVEASEQLSARLQAAGIGHVVLNAKQDAAEAEVVAAAGRAGRVTVATNMAGRGTDILLDDAARARGGLQVILTEFHDSARVDRQLLGRAARQGDPGGGEVIVALDDELFRVHAAGLAQGLAPTLAARGGGWQVALLRRVAQWAAEQRHRRVRLRSWEHDRRLATLLAFAGRPE